MRKYICLFISVFLMFSCTANASVISSSDVNVYVKKNGNAVITTTYYIKSQKDTVYEVDIFKAKNSKIKNIKVTDQFNGHYEKVDSFSSKEAFFYRLDDQGYIKKILFQTVPSDSTYTISYEITNFAVKYNDGKFGIDWFALSRISVQNINSFSVRISFEDESIINNIEAKSLLGNNDLITVNQNLLSFGGSNIDSSDVYRLMILFNDKVKFKNYTSINNTYNDSLKNANDGKDFEVLFYSYFSKEFLSGFLIIIEIGVVILLLSYIIIRYGTHDEYFGMEIANKQTIMKPKVCPYYDSVPCQGDIYKIFFVAGYFKLLRSKSGLIGAILFKLYLNDNIEIVSGKSGYEMRLRNDLKIDKSLDQDLYNIMMETSDMRVVNTSKTTKFSKKNFLRIMTWYNMGYSETITDEINRGHATRGGKVGKTTKIIFNETFVDYGNKILGMKKYLLNFNQVPRQSALSEDTYKLLLICAEMLGIGAQVSDEILRKNPTNIYAKKLKEFQALKPIYKDIYATSLMEYRKTVKNNEIYNYDAMKDSSLQSSTNVINVKR